ncbi:hypothetical protein ACP4OV_028325 [Aristida adscensionis]
MASPTPTPTELVGSTTTIDSLSDDNLREVMLRVPTPAALVHAAAASKRWRRLVAKDGFLGEYRKRHPSSPLLGVYVPAEFGGLPAFQLAGSIRAASGRARDLDLVRAATRAFLLDGLEGHGDWSVLDCHNGRLLLLLLAGAAGGDHQSLEVYCPLSCQGASVPLPPRDCDDDSPLSACLLQGRHGDDAASFRVVSVQHRCRRGRRMVRAVEYDSGRMRWEHRPWKRLNIKVDRNGQRMHAGDLIFCESTERATVLMLDTRRMQFSILHLPFYSQPYAIGEMEDGVCCLASVDYLDKDHNYLRVWKLDRMEWKLEKGMRLQEVLGKHTSYPYFSVRAVTNGIALLCSNKRSLHFSIDLKTFCIKERFEFKDCAAYPFQMPWPPTFSVAIGSDEQPAPSAGCTRRDMSGVLEGDTLNCADDKKIKAIDLNPLECKLNTEDSEIPCIDEAAPQISMLSTGLEGSGIEKPLENMPAPDQAEDYSDEENDVPDDYDLEASNFDQYLIWNQDSDSMHSEATRFDHPETRNSMERFEQVTQYAFCSIKDPKSQSIHKAESTRAPMRCQWDCVTDPTALTSKKKQPKKTPANQATPEPWPKRSRAGDHLLSGQDSNKRVRKPNSRFYGPDWEWKIS